MNNEYFEGEVGSIYGREQLLFAKMKADDHLRKRKQRRRKILMWVLRRM